MTPEQFVLEYWKFYAAYMARKEHLIEITTTVYLAFVSALLLKPWQDFWLLHVRAVAVLGAVALVLIGLFLYTQFRMWTNAAWICNSSQTLLGQWLANPFSPKDLAATDLPDSPDIKAPKALVDVMNNRRAVWAHKSFGERLRSSPFEITVYGLVAAWTVALAVQCHSALVARAHMH